MTILMNFPLLQKHVSHDGAISALLSCDKALTHAAKILNKDYSSQRKWVHDRLAELWVMRGPCPGLGAALCAFGMEYGTYVAREIECKLSENTDPWSLLEKTFAVPGKHLSKSAAGEFNKTLCDTWAHLPAQRRTS